MTIACNGYEPQKVNGLLFSFRAIDRGVVYDSGYFSQLVMELFPKIFIFRFLKRFLASQGSNKTQEAPPFISGEELLEVGTQTDDFH